MKVIFLPQTIEYFKELTDILYYKDYFGFKESAKSYVDKLIDDIENTLSIRPSKISPAYFNRYGNNMRLPLLGQVKQLNGMCFTTFIERKESYTI